MGTNSSAAINQIEEGKVSVKKTIIICAEETEQFETRIKLLVEEVHRLREENKRLAVYKKLYTKFAKRIANVFEAVRHAAEGGKCRKV